MEIMEEEGMGRSVLKRKRSKRQRLLLLPSNSSSTSSGDLSTEEEEDMANCLILLAQGRDLDPIPNLKVQSSDGNDKFVSRRFTETATTTAGKAGFYIYECKTCNKCFPSFQALGGHRASHKKSKLLADGENHDGLCLTLSKPPPPLVGGKSRVHECSICGAEFSSGQALGGHMRRHRPVIAGDSTEEPKKVLSLDLNLPAPSEDDFRRIVFSASALVDCYY